MPPRLPAIIIRPHIRRAAGVHKGIDCRRALSSASSPATAITSPPSPEQQPPSRWVSDVRARIGRCIQFGCDAEQVRRASRVVAALATDWLPLSAGSEGFLVRERRGLEGQRVVWGEMDSFGHVNNTVYLKYAEAARANWIVSFGRHDVKNREAWSALMQPKTVGLILKSITADYKFPMTSPDTVSAYHRLSVRPEAEHTSLFLDCIILSHKHRRVAARTREEVAIYDYREARKTSLPDFALGALQESWRRQQEQAVEARQRIWDLLSEVEGLEKDTWDRADAVEDLGAAGR
ncbi:thioesterase-like superfamily-domain-containing protein [Xylariaceae sp. FL0594]|nr:thioesterase-like superfamily-domain-containing protein [Xylariaceae sp. FL0594]